MTVRSVSALVFACLVAPLALAACGDGSGLADFLISDQQEVELGEGVDQQIEQEFRIVDDTDPVATWADEFVAQLVPSSAPFRNPDDIGGYKVDVISDDALVNAFAAPGGYVYITTGAILAADSCGEIAGVMGHELAHVTERHGVQTLVKSMGIQVLLDLFVGNELAQGAGLLVWDVFRGRKFSRENESESDEVGLQISHDSGYNPYGLVVFFQKILAVEQEGGSPPEFLSTHPATDDRIADVTAKIEQLYGDAVNPEGTQTYDCIGTSMTLQQVKDRITAGVTVRAGTGQGAPQQTDTPPADGT